MLSHQVCHMLCLDRVTSRLNHKGRRAGKQLSQDKGFVQRWDQKVDGEEWGPQ